MQNWRRYDRVIPELHPLSFLHHLASVEGGGGGGGGGGGDSDGANWAVPSYRLWYHLSLGLVNNSYNIGVYLPAAVWYLSYNPIIYVGEVNRRYKLVNWQLAIVFWYLIICISVEQVDWNKNSCCRCMYVRARRCCQLPLVTSMWWWWWWWWIDGLCHTGRQVNNKQQHKTAVDKKKNSPCALLCAVVNNKTKTEPIVCYQRDYCSTVLL